MSLSSTIDAWEKISVLLFKPSIILNLRKHREVVKDAGSKVQIAVWDLECKFLSYLHPVWSLTGCYFSAFLNITES